MAMALRLSSLSRLTRSVGVRCMSGQYGDGIGKGGGTGGSIRDAGGAFGKMEAAREEEYFRKKQAEQLKALKKHLKGEMDNLQESIKAHQEAIERHKKKIKELEEGESSD